MMLIEYPKERNKANKIIQRSGIDYREILPTVNAILKDIKRRQDNALFNYTKKFDKFDLNEKNIRVSRNEIRKAYKNVNPEVIRALRYSFRNIKKYHEEQFR